MIIQPKKQSAASRFGNFRFPFGWKIKANYDHFFATAGGQPKFYYRPQKPDKR